MFNIWISLISEVRVNASFHTIKLASEYHRDMYVHKAKAWVQNTVNRPCTIQFHSKVLEQNG